MSTNSMPRNNTKTRKKRQTSAQKVDNLASKIREKVPNELDRLQLLNHFVSFGFISHSEGIKVIARLFMVQDSVMPTESQLAYNAMNNLVKGFC